MLSSTNYTRFHFRLDSKDRIDFFFECNDSFIADESGFYCMMAELNALMASTEEVLSEIESKRPDTVSDLSLTFDVITDKFDLKITGTPSAEDLGYGVTEIISNLISKFKEMHNVSLEDLKSDLHNFEGSTSGIAIGVNFYQSIKEGHKKEEHQII